ncbi:DxFTY motif-containing membrane protein [Spiroplasma sp. DGKH1]|uniref:DxFTY motif-containing membrane protein n=1 Tax=Spiroplasma sp. DGKH1 TaxID=3050074 RepID=UPI0034C65BFE
MKIIDKQNNAENNTPDDNHLAPEVKEHLEFQSTRTVFWKSLLAIIVEGIAPFFLLFFLSSPDLSYADHYEVGGGIGFGLLYVVGVFLLTVLGFILKCHKADQFTYNITLSWTLFGFYLTGYWWGWDKVLYRCLVAMAFLLFSVFFGTFMAVWIRNIAEYLKAKREGRVLNPEDEIIEASRADFEAAQTTEKNPPVKE